MALRRGRAGRRSPASVPDARWFFRKISGRDARPFASSSSIPRRATTRAGRRCTSSPRPQAAGNAGGGGRKPSPRWRSTNSGLAMPCPSLTGPSRVRKSPSRDRRQERFIRPPRVRLRVVGAVGARAAAPRQSHLGGSGHPSSPGRTCSARRGRDGSHRCAGRLTAARASSSRRSGDDRGPGGARTDIRWRASAEVAALSTTAIRFAWAGSFSSSALRPGGCHLNGGCLEVIS
jgi:hypothetical protein